MKRMTLLFLIFLVQICIRAQEEYYPEGTKWTEIRLDTLKYNSWYSKVGDEWVPNFETIEYYVNGEYKALYRDNPFKCVYTNGPEWTDSLTLIIYEKNSSIDVSIPIFSEDKWGNHYIDCYPGNVYQFDWSIGKGLYYRDICESNTTSECPYLFYYGIINEIKEGYFGGIRPLKYVDLDGKAPYIPGELGITDTKGGRIIQGIGITEWNDGECLFGPPNPYWALTLFDPDSYYWDKYPERHYRSMLVHFERDGEVLYDVWPQKEKTTKIVSPLNPSDKEMVNVKSSNRKFYDLQGRRIDNSKLPRGIYIENGKKIAIK